MQPTTVLFIWKVRGELRDYLTTGLAITILCIITLFIVMQLTGKIDWAQQFSKSK
ncbi:MAG: hypothetical protein WBB67_10065 [bacterium]